MKTLVCLAALAVTVGARAADLPEGKNTLFLSADLNITYHGGLYHVNQVDRGYFIINVEGKPVKVAPNERAGVAIKIKRQLHLAPFSARIDHWVAERAYAIGSDPEMVAAVDFGEQRDIQDAAEQSAWDEYTKESLTLDIVHAAAVAPGTIGEEKPKTRDTDPVLVRDRAAAMTNVQNQRLEHNSDLVLSGAKAWQNAHETGGPTPYDAVRVSFEVSSPQPLLQPYVILVGVFHEYEKPRAKHIWIGARELDAVTAGKQRFHLLQDGFPKGFELEKVTVHLYDRGAEIATNLADQRMELSREDTFSFLLMDYLQRHKDATLPATLAMTKVPADWHDRIRLGAYAQKVYVKVGKDGRPQGLFANPDCSQPVADDYLRGVVMNVRFRPALAQGKPIAAVVPMVPISSLR